MPGARKWHSLLAILLILLPPPAQGAPSKEEELQGEKRTLLELIKHVTVERSSGRAASRRYSIRETPELQQRARPTELAEPTLRQNNRRAVEIFLRDLNLKEKFIKHFTGPVTFSSDCNKSFHRLYHNTRDCSIPAYYKRCARLLTRLAMSPSCTQS
ncbi:ALK and LTK ligand 1 isoform X2 [Pleurodeles waltl]